MFGLILRIFAVSLLFSSAVFAESGQSNSIQAGMDSLELAQFKSNVDAMASSRNSRPVAKEKDGSGNQITILNHAQGYNGPLTQETEYGPVKIFNRIADLIFGRWNDEGQQ
jgi:hypothetical protein